MQWQINDYEKIIYVIIFVGIEKILTPMGFSKALDNLNHDLFITKLYAYGFNSLLMITCIIDNKRQKSNRFFRIGHSWCKEFLKDLHWTQCFLNIDLFNLAESTEACNFADDKIVFVRDKDLQKLISRFRTWWSLSYWMVWKQLHETKPRQVPSINFWMKY